MKKIIISVLLGICTIIYSTNTQYNKSKNSIGAIQLKGISKLPLETQIEMLREFILFYYGKSFIYFDALKGGTCILKIKGVGKTDDNYIEIFRIWCEFRKG